MQLVFSCIVVIQLFIQVFIEVFIQKICVAKGIGWVIL